MRAGVPLVTVRTSSSQAWGSQPLIPGSCAASMLRGKSALQAGGNENPETPKGLGTTYNVSGILDRWHQRASSGGKNNRGELGLPRAGARAQLCLAHSSLPVLLHSPFKTLLPAVSICPWAWPGTSAFSLQFKHQGRRRCVCAIRLTPQLSCSFWGPAQYPEPWATLLGAEPHGLASASLCLLTSPAETQGSPVSSQRGSRKDAWRHKLHASRPGAENKAHKGHHLPARALGQPCTALQAQLHVVPWRYKCPPRTHSPWGWRGEASGDRKA